MGMESLLGAGASIVGGLIGADGASDAANIQAGATREANALQQKQYEQTRNDLAGYRGLGSAATNRLAQLLGLDMPVETVGGLTREQLRAQLLPQFTRTIETPGSSGGVEYGGASPESASWVTYGTAPTTTTSVDEAGLSAAIDRQFAEAQAQANAARQSPDFGSLLKNFTGQDLQNEPGYQFGLQQGQRALDNKLASSGSYFSGAALKAASRYNQDYAGTKFNDAFNRDSANKTRAYNFLSGAVGTGQNSAAMTGQAGAAMAGQVGANTTAMGNAAGAARIAEGNAWGNALQNAVGGYREDQLLNRVLGGNQGFGSMAREGMRTNGMAGYNSIYG